MAAVRSRVAGRDAVRARLAGLPGGLRAAAADGLSAVAQAAEDHVRAALAKSPGPSAPGAPPADPGGRLAGSVASIADPEAGPGRVAARVTVGAPAAAFLEFGTVRMAARPFLRPAARAAARGAMGALAAALRKGLRP